MRASLPALLAVAGLLPAAALATECDLKAAQAPNEARCARQWMDENLRVNDLLSVGTHNSYKLAIPEAELAQLRARSPRAAITLDYAHRDLAAALDDGARQLELDVYYDPQGGRFADPLGPRTLRQRIDARDAAELARPGFKVLHVPDIDFRSNCLTFVACLRTIEAWSDAHPAHVPILILINAKDDNPVGSSGTAVAKFDAAAFDALDAEIASVFGADDLITPDDVQGRHPTLRDAVLAGGWPKLRDARGKVFVALDDTAQKVAIYRGSRPSLEGRRMFANIEETSPAAAYITLNEPLRDAQRIRAAVESGLIVRTRADADTAEARSGSTERREAALASGAQYVSTDYMQPDPRFGSYSARLPGKATAVCNPVRAQKKCAGQAVAE
jgi:hypothetical protein